MEAVLSTLHLLFYPLIKKNSPAFTAKVPRREKPQRRHRCSSLIFFHFFLREIFIKKVMGFPPTVFHNFSSILAFVSNFRLFLFCVLIIKV